MPFKLSLKSSLFVIISLLFAAHLSAQSPFVCNGTALPSVVRETGLAELVGDVVLNCTGGTPTQPGSPIPQMTIQVNLNTNITSRLLSSSTGLSEALLVIDEAYPANPVPVTAGPAAGAPPQILCAPLGASCAETGTGGSPSPYQTQPNVFVGQQMSPTSIAWQVPIDPPGTGGGTRIIRITNIRANALQLGPTTSPLTPVFLTEQISAAGPLAMAINYPSQIVAINQAGVVPGLSGANALLQCSPHNASLVGGTGTPAFDFTVQATEGFAAAFKFRNYGTVVDGVEDPQQLVEQNLFGFSYNTETAFYSPSLFTTAPTLGLADFGTRILVAFQGVTPGTHLFVPTSIAMQNMNCPSCTDVGQLQLVQSDQNGFSAPGYVPVTATATVGSTPVAEVNYVDSTAYATYEIVNANVTALEAANIPVAVAFDSSAPPTTGVTTATTSLAPISSVLTADPTAPLPRFGSVSAVQTAYAINSCSPAPLSGGLLSESGPDNARVWDIDINTGANPAFGVTIQSFTLTQTFGAKCSPTVVSPSFPDVLNDISYIPANSSTTVPVTIDFTGCAPTARFSVDVELSANDGASTGSIVRYNQFR